MKHRVIVITLVSLALGIVLTSAFMAQMNWISFGDCARTYNQTLPESIRRVDCSGLAYGFPFKFIQSRAHLDISYITEVGTSPTMLGVSAQTNIDKGKLALNVLLWSIISAIVISAALYKTFSRPSKDLQVKNKNSRSL